MKFKLGLLFFFCTLALHAQIQQQVHFEHTTIDQGLSQNSIQCIIQDKTGFIWFGTGDGLNQFDGYQFKIFNTDPLNQQLLSSGNIQCLLKDHNGIIWIGTDGGLNSYDPATAKITRYKHDEKNTNSIPSDNIRALAERQGQLWIGTADAGLCSYDLRKRTFKTFQHRDGDLNTISSNRITCLYVENDQAIWAGTEDSGLCLFMGFDGATKHYKGLGKVNCIYRIDKSGPLLVGTDNGLAEFLHSGEMNVFKHDDKKASSISNDQVTAITIDQSNNIWIGTNGGLNKFNPKTKEFSSCHHDILHSYTLSDDRITCLFTDKAGEVWVGTYSGGVDAINPPNVFFKNYRHEAGNANSMSYDDISSIIEDHDKNIWVGTLGGGLNFFNPSTESFKSFHKGNGPNTLSSDNINCLFEDHNGMIWIGTQDGGLNLYDPRENKFQCFKKGMGANSIPSNTILSLQEDFDNNLWIGTDEEGIALMNIDTREVKPFHDKDNISARLKKYQVRIFYRNQNDMMWIGTLGGGFFGYNFKTKTLTNYVHKEEKNSLSDNKIFSIFQDLNGRLWIGTNGGGLNLFDPQTGKFRFFTVQDGIPNNVIYGILDDQGENLWLNTDKGICRFSPPTDIGASKFIAGKVKVSKKNNNSKTNKPNTSDINVRIYDSRDGLPSNQFNIGAYLKTLEGKMYLGSISGMVTFDPDTVKDNPYIPPVVITDFKLFNRSVLPDDSFKILKSPISETKEIHLKYNQNFLSFEFTALNYINPKKNRYSFKLEGFDNDWSDADAQRRFATYTNLEPGDYTFRVKGSNNDGIWNEKGASIHIIIEPPFWQTWWFRIVAAILIITSIYLAIYIRLNQIRKKEEQKTEVNKLISEARLIALRAQMNPHFIFNSLNSIQQFIYNNNREEAATYLSKFSKLIRLILEHSSQGTILLQDESSILNLYLELESLRFQHKFGFDIEIDEDIDPGYTEIPSMLIQPYIENAILHGLVNKEGEGHISIHIKPDPNIENVLMVSIEDNGIGRAAAMEINKKKVFKYKNKSMGMSVTNDRLTILNNYQKQNIAMQIIDLKDDKGNALGTRVEIRLPVDET